MGQSGTKSFFFSIWKRLIPAIGHALLGHMKPHLLHKLNHLGTNLMNLKAKSLKIRSTLFICKYFLVKICSRSTPFQKSINILVITSETKLCSPHVSYTARGTFRWGVAVGGHTVQQSCPSARQQQRGFGFAYYLCRQTGEWASSVNASQCAYTSSTTETLHKFANFASLHNTSFDTATLMESAKHFLNFTSNPEIFQDPLDIIYFSRAVENYLPYLKVRAYTH